MDVIVSNVKIV